MENKENQASNDRSISSSQGDDPCKRAMDADAQELQQEETRAEGEAGPSSENAQEDAGGPMVI